MLKAMRKNVKSLAPTLWIVIAAFVIAIFAVWGGAGRLGETRAANIIVRVGKEKISADFYYQNLRQRLEMLKGEFKDLNRNFIQQLNIPQQVLEQIIQQSLLLQMAQEMGIDATEEEIREKIVSYPVFQKDGKFIGFEEYKRILDWNRIPVSQFEQSLRKEIILDKLIQVLTAGVSITEDEIWENYKTNNESAKLEFVLAEKDKTELKEDPSSEEIKAYFEDNREKFQIPEKRNGVMVFLKTDDLKDEIELEDSEIEKYYKNNLSQFTENEKVRISRIYFPYEDKDKELVKAEGQNILDKIQRGEDFAEQARMHSKDEKAQDGGDWGLFDWKRLSSKEQEEIEKLAPGQNSDLIELEDGISILKITEKNPSITKPLEEVKARITTVLKDQKTRELADRRIAHLEKRARKEKSVDIAAQELGLKIRNIGLLEEGEGIEDIDPSGSISQALFKLKEKEISSLIYTYKGIGVVQLKKTAPSRRANFEEVEEKAKEELIAIRKKGKALESVKKIKAELEKKELEELAKKYELEYKTAEEHRRGQYLSTIGENEEVDRLSFSLPISQASEPIEFENGYALIKVLDRKEVTREDFEKNKKEEKENLLEAKKNRFLQSYLNKLRNDKGVKIKYDLFLKINSDILSRFEGKE